MDNAHSPDHETGLFQSHFVALLIVASSSLAFGLVPYFARILSEMGLAAAAIAFYRYAFTPVILFRHIKLDATHRKATLWGIAAGMGTGLGWIGYVSSLDSMPVSTAGILYMTYPIFTLLFSRVIFGEALTLRASVAAVLILGAAILGAGELSADGTDMRTIALALTAPLSFGFVINVITYKLVSLPATARMTTVPLGSMIVLTPILFTLPTTQVLPQSLEAVIALCLLGSVTALIPNALYMRFAPKIGANASAVAGSIELPTMFVVGWLAFGEPLSAQQAVAGTIILLAITLSSARRMRNIATNVAVPRRRKLWTKRARSG